MANEKTAPRAGSLKYKCQFITRRDRAQRRKNIDSHYVSRWFTCVLHVWYRLYVPMQMGRELLRVPFSEIMLRFLNSRLKQIASITRAYRPLIYHRFSQIIFTILNAFPAMYFLVNRHTHRIDAIYFSFEFCLLPSRKALPHLQRVRENTCFSFNFNLIFNKS